MGGCKKYGPFVDTPINTRCRIIIGIRKWTIILTTTHIGFRFLGSRVEVLGVLGLRC